MGEFTNNAIQIVPNYNKMIAIQNSINCYQPEMQNHKKSDTHLREAMYNAAINMTMQCNVKPSKKNVIYPKV